MKVIVVGAGIAGLATATWLAGKGHDVKVLDASNRVGGRAVTYTHPTNGDRCDVGTQYYHSSYTRALGLMRDVGLGNAVKTISGSTRFFDDRVASGSFLVGHRLPWFSSAGIGGNARLGYFLISRLLGNPISTFALEDRPKLDDVRALDVVTDPMLREFAVRVVVNAGTLAEPEVTNVSLLQLIRLLRIIVLTDYLALPDGVASLHEQLAARLNVDLEAPVARVLVEGNRAVGVELDGSAKTLRADHVVITAPPRAAAPMLPAEWETERTFLSGVEFPPAMIVSLFLDRPLEAGVWSYMIQSGREQWISFCTDATQKNASMVPSGNSILQAWICHPRAAALSNVSDNDVMSRCTAELDHYLPGIASWVQHAHVMRHAGGTPQHSAGHHGRALAFLRSADTREGISFAGDYFSGGYLEPALWSAERVVSRIG